MKTCANFAMPMADNGRKLVRALQDQVAIESEGKERRRWTILDTFDWRLLSEGWAMLRDRRSCELHRCDGDDLVAEAELPSATKSFFADDLPAGALRDKVTGPMWIRAVITRAEFVREGERFCVINRDSKTTVRVELETLARPVSGQKPIPFQRAFRVVALKGYEADAARVADQVESHGLSPCSDMRHYVFAALEACGVTPFDYTSKIKLELSPELTASEACTQILASSWTQMQVNTPGMLADIDSEYLHDFRVALRRTRSLLQLVKGVYPEDLVQRFKKELGDVMRSTNRLRDLDVYLLEETSYRELLPTALRPGLDLFFKDLRKERAAAVKRFAKDFQSAAVKKKLNAWESFLEKPAKQTEKDCPDTESPVRVLASRLLRKRFNKIIKDGRKITDDTSDEAVHELRIQFKKLRYLLEFFRSLYDSHDLNFLIKRSRKMQNVLGNFNDVCVQQQTISDYLKSVDLKRPEAVQLCAALGALVAEMERKRIQIRRQYHQAFRTLDDPKVLAIAEQLFSVRLSADEIPDRPESKPSGEGAKKKATTRKRTSKKSAQ